MKLLTFLTLLVTSLAFSSYSQSFQILNLKTEYSETPLGIDVEKPRFSWQMLSKVPGAHQTAYQIGVINASGDTVWNSGKILKNISLNIKYEGTLLTARTRYNWFVKVWNQNLQAQEASSWFETGLMDTHLSAWSGAKWIGGANEDMVFYSDYLPVFKISVSIQLDKKSNSSRAGFIYGANDSRLMDRNKNLYHLQSPVDSSYILAELDLAPLSTNSPALLNLYRFGYTSHDKKDKPFKSFPIPTTLLNGKNKYDKHTFYFSSNLGQTEVFVNEEKSQNRLGSINLNPLGAGGDFIAFPVLASVGYYVPDKQKAYFSNLQVRNFRSPSNPLYADWSSYVVVEGKKNGSFKVFNPSRNSTPMLRTTFSTWKGTIAKARLYVTARGIYEMYLNGKRVSKDYFNPGLTQYNKTHLYQTYDVTENIQQGKNTLGAILSEGWWSGGSTYMGEYWNFFGDRQSLLAKLVISYEDGKEEVVVSEPSTWSYFSKGPIICGSFFQGEVYDATKEKSIEDWCMPSYNSSGWKGAVEVPLTGTISLDERNKSANMPMTDDFSKMKLIGQPADAIRKIKELKAISVEEVRPGVFVYDMGQNMAGVSKVNLNGMKPGRKITLRFAEVKYPDLPAYKGNEGMIMLENIRAAMAQDIYITRGGDETINPRFTYRGFRFVEITGIDKPLPLDAVKADVLSSVHELASKYETSNPKVNKLWENITWSTYANFMSIPTDCPQRNERLGWSGDISVFSRTATYLASVPGFLRKHMLAMRDVQREDGRFSDVAPLGGGFGGALWGSAGITVAWESYQQYGDKDLLAEHYDAMKRYIDFLIKSIDPKTNVIDENLRDKWWGLGDWLSPEYNKTEKSLLWEAYLLYDLQLMNKIASILNRNEDAQRYDRLYFERRNFFNATYTDPGTGKTAFRGKEVDTQASYAIPLAFGIFDEKFKPLASKSLEETVSRANKADDGTICPPFSLMTGFIGTAWISGALSDYGSKATAYRLLQQTSYPSWLYSVEQGATTIWERTNSYTHIDGFGGNNRMNSFNHYSFGAVGAWMYDHSLGIKRDEVEPGFKHFALAPEPDPTGEMTYAKGYYDSMYGRIESGWSVKDGESHYQFVVPANTTATLHLNARSVSDIYSYQKKLVNLNSVKYIGSKNGKQLFELGAGKYEVIVKDFKNRQ